MKTENLLIKHIRNRLQSFLGETEKQMLHPSGILAYQLISVKCKLVDIISMGRDRTFHRATSNQLLTDSIYTECVPCSSLHKGPLSIYSSPTLLLLSIEIFYTTSCSMIMRSWHTLLFCYLTAVIYLQSRKAVAATSPAQFHLLGRRPVRDLRILHSSQLDADQKLKVQKYNDC